MAPSYSRGTPSILSAVNSMSATFASSVRVVEFRWMAFNGWHSPFARTIYAISVWAEFFSLVTMPPFDNDFFIGRISAPPNARVHRVIPLERHRCVDCNRRNETSLVPKLADVCNFEQ